MNKLCRVCGSEEHPHETCLQAMNARRSAEVTNANGNTVLVVTKRRRAAGPALAEQPVAEVKDVVAETLPAGEEDLAIDAEATLVASEPPSPKPPRKQRVSAQPASPAEPKPPKGPPTSAAARVAKWRELNRQKYNEGQRVYMRQRRAARGK